MPPLFIAALSLLPGAGHWAIGKRGKAAALFAVDIGIVCSHYFIKSQAGYLLAGFAYLMVMIPAVIETYALACGGKSLFSESKPYIVILLLVTGFSAMPILWQSHVFSKRIKIVWSILVFTFAVLYFSFLGVYGSRLFNYAKMRLG